ncbi:MAG: hypothetical protein MUQ10_09005, partial [Anaerolineae bacterium]|nr:hypothetical protein [Anaerolineae bacterium]
MVDGLHLAKDQIFTKEEVLDWFRENYPKVATGTISAHLVRQSTNAPSRVHYSGKPGDDDVFYKIDGSHYRLYDPVSDPPPLYRDDTSAPVSDAEVEDGLAFTDEILGVIQKRERHWQRRTKDCTDEIARLKREIERLQNELA